MSLSNTRGTIIFALLRICNNVNAHTTTVDSDGIE